MSEDKVSVKEALEKDFGDLFKPCNVNEANQTVIENGQAIIRGLRAGVGVIDPKIVESISQICYALLKSGNKLTDEEQKIFDNYRKTGQLEMMSDDNIDDWEDSNDIFIKNLVSSINVY